MVVRLPKLLLIVLACILWQSAKWNHVSSRHQEYSLAYQMWPKLRWTLVPVGLQQSLLESYFTEIWEHGVPLVVMRFHLSRYFSHMSFRGVVSPQLTRKTRH